MRTFLPLFALTLLFLPSSQRTELAQKSSVVLKNMQAEYRSLAEVAPILVNEGDKPIYLLPEDCGEAQVLIAGHQVWEPSDPLDCPQSVDPIEIKPGESYHIPSLVWRLEVDKGKWNEERKGSAGKWKIVMHYSLNPIHRQVNHNGPPQLKVKYVKWVEKEFSIVK